MDVFLMISGSIVLSIVVDDSLHLLVHLKESINNNKLINSKKLFSHCFEIVGFGMFNTTIVIILGFLTFTFSSFPIHRHFGLIISLGTLLGLLSNLILFPALYALFDVQKNK